MNAQRRAMINRLLAGVAKLNESLDTGPIEALKDSMEEVRDAEQEAFNNLPESMQEGEKGEKMQAAIEALDRCIEPIQELLNIMDGLDFDEMTESLEEAAQ